MIHPPLPVNFYLAHAPNGSLQRPLLSFGHPHQMDRLQILPQTPLDDEFLLTALDIDDKSAGIERLPSPLREYDCVFQLYLPQLPFHLGPRGLGT